MNSFSVLLRLSKHQPIQIENKGSRLNTLIQTSLKILQRSLQITEGIIQKAPNQKQRRIILNRQRILA